jgi:hypothetical protein
VEFTCPHCGKPFEVKRSKWRSTEAANAARKRNGALGGHTKATPDQLSAVYAKLASKGEAVAWQVFVAAVKKQTGFVYSRAQAFLLLRKLRIADAVLFGPSNGFNLAVGGSKPTKGKKTVRRKS